MQRIFFILLLQMVTVMATAQQQNEQPILLAAAEATTEPTNRVRSDGPDNVLEYTPWIAALSLRLAGLAFKNDELEGASSWKRFAVNAGMSLLLTDGVVYTLKHTIHERRPDGSDNKSFPSGHSAVAFAGATVLMKEYRHLSPWIGIAGYGVATFTAIDRVDRNKHHWFDVISGAGIGILGTHVAYWLGDKITGEHSRYRIGFDGRTIGMVVRF